MESIQPPSDCLNFTINEVENCEDSDRIIPFFNFISQSNFEILQGLKNRITYFNQNHSLRADNSQIIVNLCQRALQEVDSPSARQMINVIIEECESAKYPELTYESIGEAWQLAMKGKNLPLMKRCFEFVKQETRVDLDTDRRYNFESKKNYVSFLGAINSRNLDRLLGIVGPFLSTQWALKVSKLNEETFVFLGRLGSKLSRLELSGNCLLPELKVIKEFCPNLLTLQLSDVPLTLDVVSDVLEKSPYTIEILQSNIELDEYEKYDNKRALKELLMLAIEGQSILMPCSLLNFSSLHPSWIMNYLEKCLVYFLKSSEFTSQRQEADKTVQSPPSRIPREILYYETENRLKEYWIEHLTDPLFFKHKQLFFDNFTEWNVTEGILIEPTTDANIQVKLARALILQDFNALKDIEEFIKAETGIRLHLFRKKIGTIDICLNKQFAELYLSESSVNIERIQAIFSKIIPFIGTNWLVSSYTETRLPFSKLLNIFRVIGPSIQSVDLSQSLSPTELEKILLCCPHLKELAFSYPCKHEDFSVALRYCSVIMLDARHFSPTLIKKFLTQIIKEGRNVIFDGPTPYEVLDPAFIEEHFLACLRLECERYVPHFEEDIHATFSTDKFSTVLLNNENVLKVLESALLLPQFSRDLILECLAVLKVKYSSGLPKEINELKQLFNFLLDNHQEIDPHSLTEFGKLFEKLEDISCLFSARTISELINFTRLLDIPFPPSYINEANVVELILVAKTNYHIKLVDSCFLFIKNKYCVELAFQQQDFFQTSENSVLEILLIEDCFIQEVNDVLSKLGNLYNKVYLNTKSILPKEHISFFDLIGTKIKTLEFRDNLSRVSPLVCKEILRRCPNLSAIAFSSAHAIEDESLSPLSHLQELKSLKIENCSKVKRLPDMAETPVSFIQIKNCGIRELPELNSKVYVGIEIVKLEFDDLTSFQKLEEGSLYLTDVKLSEKAQKQLCHLLFENKKTIMDERVDVQEEYFLEVFDTDNLGDQYFLDNFDKLNQDYRNNSSVFRIILPKLAKGNPEKYLLNYPQLVESILKYFPPNSKDNVYLYPVNFLSRSDVFGLKMVTLKSLVHPYEVLSAFSFTTKITGLEIEYEDSKGRDASGLSRQCISQVFQGLINCESESIRFTLQAEGGYIPNECGTLKPTNREQLIAIGKLLAFAANSKGKYLVGEIFTEGFYRALKNLHENEFEGEIALSRLVDLFDQLFGTSEKEKFFKPYVELMELSSPNMPYEKDGGLKNINQLIPVHRQLLKHLEIEETSITDIRKELTDHFVYMAMRYVSVLRLIARGFNQMLPITIGDEAIESWEEFQVIGVETLKTAIQGVLTKDSLKDLIKVTIKPISPHVMLTPEQQALAEVTTEMVKEWIYEWIDQHSIEEIKNVLRAITGASTASTAVKFDISEARDLIPHTCFNLVDVPRRITKEQFMARLDLWGAGIDISDYTIA